MRRSIAYKAAQDKRRKQIMRIVSTAACLVLIGGGVTLYRLKYTAELKNAAVANTDHAVMQETPADEAASENSENAIAFAPEQNNVQGVKAESEESYADAESDTMADDETAEQYDEIKDETAVLLLSMAQQQYPAGTDSITVTVTNDGDSDASIRADSVRLESFYEDSAAMALYSGAPETPDAVLLTVPAHSSAEWLVSLADFGTPHPAGDYTLHCGDQQISFTIG